MISNSGKRTSKNHKIPILIKKVKRPKVKNLKGKKIFSKIGLIKKLISPKTSPQKRKVSIGPTKFTPGTNFIAKKSPRSAMMICKMSLPTQSMITKAFSKVNQKGLQLLVFYGI